MAFHSLKMITSLQGTVEAITTEIVNLEEFARQLNRPALYLLKFLGFEMDVQTTFQEKNRRYFVGGKHEGHHMQCLLLGFISEFVRCPSCEMNRTELMVSKKKKVSMKCKDCDYNGAVKSKHKVMAYMMRNPLTEETKKYSEQKKKAEEQFTGFRVDYSFRNKDGELFEGVLTSHTMPEMYKKLNRVCQKAGGDLNTLLREITSAQGKVPVEIGSASQAFSSASSHYSSKDGLLIVEGVNAARFMMTAVGRTAGLPKTAVGSFGGSSPKISVKGVGANASALTVGEGKKEAPLTEEVSHHEMAYYVNATRAAFLKRLEEEMKEEEMEESDVYRFNCPFLPPLPNDLLLNAPGAFMRSLPLCIMCLRPFDKNVYDAILRCSNCSKWTPLNYVQFVIINPSPNYDPNDKEETDFCGLHLLFYLDEKPHYILLNDTQEMNILTCLITQNTSNWATVSFKKGTFGRERSLYVLKESPRMTVETLEWHFANKDN